MSARPSHLSPRPHSHCWGDSQSSVCPPMSQEGRRTPRAAPEPGTSGRVMGSEVLPARCCGWLLGSGLRPRGLCTCVRVAFESGEAAWDLGSEGRCLDLHPHGQAATGRGVGVLGGDSHSGRSQLSGGLDAGCRPHLAHVRLPGCCGRRARCSDTGFPPRSQAKG